ncbi:hypothetical protein HA402_000233 [Bradysia odoriphaga]|nr:hypothetical protein HA402_000233 [Bradysia odoriphaga]
METERPEHQGSDFLGMPQPGQIAYANISNSNSNFTTGDIVIDSSMAWLLGSLFTSMLWITYITFYNSRVVGYFCTKIINRFSSKGVCFKIGSLTINPIAGKIMFRDIVFVCFDYSFRVLDGYFIFRWWRTYVPKDVSEDLSHSDTRLSVMLNGLEVHVYNRSELYAKLERTFGLKPSILVPTENMTADECAKLREMELNLENERKNSYCGKKKKVKPEAMAATTWRDLIPVIKIDICSGRFVFGNRLTPTTLSICVEEAHCVYSTKPAVSRLDCFMHFIKAKADNAKILLAPSPKYTGLVDDPPRYMGEGFVVMMSNLVELYFYMDEPGIVPQEPQVQTLANGDVVEAAPPVWGIDLKCGKGTDFSYGPWASRQLTDHLYKFFFPPDWQTMLVTQPPQPGEKREYQSFEISLSTLNEATIDVLFSKNKETNAMHVTIGPGSYLEVTMPWITLQDGYSTKVSGQLLHVEATTSLQYRSLAKCETLEFKVRVHYPIRWNDHQEWNINLTGCKATAYIVYAHKQFFQDLVEDWGSKARPDILSFVPYTWKFGILLKEFEILTLCNEFNWIDCSSTNQENNHLAFCGDLFDLSFALPFDDFLPQTVPLRFWIHGEGLDLSLYLPEIATTRPVVLAMDENLRILTRDGQVKKRSEMVSKKWRKDCQRSQGWIDCWSVPIVALSIQYTYHPMPPLGPGTSIFKTIFSLRAIIKSASDPQADITTPEKEELLLSPMRIPIPKIKSPAIKWNQSDGQQFDPSTLPPDKVSVDIEIGSSILLAYGTVLRNFINLKENIFGEDQAFTDMGTSNTKSNVNSMTQLQTKIQNLSAKEETAKSISEVSLTTEEKPKIPFDPRLYRPLEVIVSLTIHDIQAHLVKNCNENDPPCPVVLIERLGFEMKKRFFETELQILVSPSFLISSDNVVRPNKDKHLKQGHLLLSAVQVRGHAMFSNDGRTLDEETLEYAWMLEVQLGKLSGKITIPQLCHVVTGLETLLTLAIDAENELRPPKPLRYCHHGVPSHLCSHSKDEMKYRCPSSEDIKYRMTRVAIDAIDLYLIESGTALHTWVSPIRVSTCNLHGQKVKSGVTCLVSTVLLRHFISTSGHFTPGSGTAVNSYSNTNTTGSGRSAKLQHQNSKSDEKKEDLNVLFKRDDGNAIKFKRESDYGTYRRGSKEKDDVHNLRRSRESDFHHRRDDIYSSIYSSNREKNREIDTEPWLEVGCVSLGPIIVESASALPIPEHCLHLVQHKYVDGMTYRFVTFSIDFEFCSYLKTHDKRAKRLWFLWSVEGTRCGCTGGSAFFGSNINGPKFFKPSAQDVQDGVNIARYQIHSHSKEYGFGQSLLHEGQLVFHTPPYSLQPVSLQEGHESFGKANIRISKPDIEQKSPLSHHKHFDQSPKPRDNGSPSTLERKNRRFSYANSRQNISTTANEVPYARLLDSPSRVAKGKDQIDAKVSPTPSMKHEYGSYTPKALRIPAPKTSSSDSKLTVDYFQDSEHSVKHLCISADLGLMQQHNSSLPLQLQLPEEMSHSAPQPHPLESDSESSLSPKIMSEEEITREVCADRSLPTTFRYHTIPLQVQRTISLTSENPSEAFFSADEDIHTSRSSSLRTTTDRLPNIPKKRFASDLSIGAQAALDGKLSSHRSDYEIHSPEHRSIPKRPQSTAELNEDDRRIHGLATPLRKMCSISPRPEFRHFKPIYAESQESSSGSPSLSSNSFISAMSSQEDITLVNLHMQVNKPIVDSPLLMASYVTHLAQLRCANWSHCCMPFGADAFSTPLFQQNDDGGLVYIGSKLVPHFDTYSNWREVRIVSRSDSNGSGSGLNTVPKSHPWDPSVMLRHSDNVKDEVDNEFMSTQSDTATRNSVIIRLKGHVEVMLTPLLLEGLQRMIEIIVPTFATMHPLTVVNYLHSSCISKVEAANILKRDQSLSYWSQVHSNSKRSTAERNLQGPGGGAILTDVYEESLSTQIQGMVVIQRINVSLIQSSVVEEVISFAALDNVQDLSCASLLAVSFEGITSKFHLGKTTKASMHTVYTQPTIRSSGLKKGRIMKGTRALLSHLSSQSRSDNIPGEPILIETSEKQQEELVITLDIAKTHSQLRRLKNEGCAQQDSQIIVTAIPPNKTRAMFECIKFPEPGMDATTLGYVMFECGLEGISTKIVKRSQFEKSENTGSNTIKTTHETDISNIDISQLTVHNDVGASAIETSSVTKVNETTSRFSVKKPSTPKPITPREKLQSSSSKEVKDKDTHSKENKIKFTLKPTEQEDKDVKDAAGSTNNTTNPPPSGTGSNSGVVAVSNNNGRVSSCVIELKTVWFNFAAPPRAPITRKIDFTRLDWNLLSTASPAITAWMNPSNRFAIKLVAMRKTWHLRRTAVAACLMADGLEVQGIQKHVKSRYSGKFTPLAKTLQEDPSCQLCTMMQKLVIQETAGSIESVLKQQDLPALTTLRQGVIVLSRQWKNMLYNPMLFEHQYKNKLNRPINVQFAVQVDEFQEKEPIFVIKLPENPVDHLMDSKLSNSNTTSPMLSSIRSRKKPRAPPAHSSRSSIQMFPIISGLVEKQNLGIEYGALQDGSIPSYYSSTNSLNKNWSPPPNSGSNQEYKEDLYSWMAKAHSQTQKESKHESHAHGEMKRPISPPRPTVNGIMQESVRLLDAHLIFEPILTCLGVMPNNISNSDVSSLDSLGTNLSLVGSFDVMRIDIVVSEGCEKKLKTRTGRKGNGKFSLTMPEETPAFLCERVGVELEVMKMTDGFPEDAKPNVPYLSRGQLKKHISTVVNFSLNIRYISQQVNMPLLRLLHQITNMYQNVKEAQNELREQPGNSKRIVPLKDESSLASEVNDPTLIGSIPDAANLDEQYDKFNESYQIGHSVSRTRMPTLGPLIPLTPSPSARNRPQSFAQKLKSTSKSVKGKLGYTNLTETVSTPIKKSPSSSTFEHPIQLQKSSSDHKNSITGVSSLYDYVGHRTSLSNITTTVVVRNAPASCWKTMYHLLDLYATMPETKTVSQRISASPEAAEKNVKKQLIGQNDGKMPRNREEDDESTPIPPADMISPERSRLVVFGVAKIQKTRLLATLSGLKLEAEIGSLHSSATWRKKSKAALEASHTGQVGRAMIVLLEGVAPTQQTVVKVTVGKSQTLYSSASRRGKDKNSGLLSIGPVMVDIPQHPVALHGMMTRSSKQLSSTLQELRTRSSARLSRQTEEPDSPLNVKQTATHSQKVPPYPSKSAASHPFLLQPLVIQFNILLQSLSVTAALLPSLQAQYKMDHVSSAGVSGNKAKFTIDLPNHSLSFTTKVHGSEANNLPSEACIALPEIHVSAEYIPENAPQDIPIDGVVLRQGGYVAASAEIGDFERCLTTDLLNHLVFVQKVFMREVNEVVQKVYGGEKPVPIWLDDNDENGGSSIKRILFSLNIRVKRIQLTATTPCSSAVRFETGQLELHLSNRVKNIAEGANTKLFGKAQIDFNLSLGQIIKNVMFDEAEPEFQQYAFFNTTIGLRNAFQDEMLNDDKELVLITLKRPLIYIQPVAVDKAILVWLNYKNAYEYWAEKRANLNKEVLTATQQVFQKMPFGQFSQHLGANNLSTLFLQLTVEDMGICLPLNPLPLSSWPSRSYQDFEPRGAVVITLENTIISACNSGSLVSTGKFFGLCLRFADDFETTLDDWKPSSNDASINLCIVSEGTYEVCSRTIAAKHLENAKWILNVKWQMEGVDIHLDVNVGKYLSALGHTLTTLSGFEEDETTVIESPDSDEGDQVDDSLKETVQKKRKTLENLPAFLFDPTLDSKKRSLMMETEMNEQLKIINDLRTLGASRATVGTEERRLQELQALCYRYFRRDMIQKWKRPMRRSMLKSTHRSQSFVVQSPDRDDVDAEIGTLDTIFATESELGSVHSSPKSGPSRSASLKIRGNQTQRVAFSDTMRQSSLPSADCETGGGGFPISDWREEAEYSDLQILEVDGEQVELRKKSPNHPQKQEPNIDFELDIKVLVNSGKCVLHTKDLNDEKLNVTTGVKQHKRERSIGTDFGSPIPSRRNKDRTRLRYNAMNAVLVDLTIFHIPGLDVKLHYDSRTISDDSSPRLSTCESFTGNNAVKRLGSKRASLFAAVTLQSVPEETIISPHILEFLEQTLEPIPFKSEISTVPVNIDLLQENYVQYASFPVDVIVYFHMQPSTFRFSCLPVSRVECMLQLPSLDYSFQFEAAGRRQIRRFG